MGCGGLSCQCLIKEHKEILQHPWISFECTNLNLNDKDNELCFNVEQFTHRDMHLSDDTKKT